MSKVVAVISDLIFGSKVTGTGSALGVEVSLVSSPSQAGKPFAAGASLVIVDMALPDNAAQTAIRDAKSHGAKHVVAFFSHVETHLKEAAREAGADEVIPRSAFVTRLPELLQEIAETR